MTAGRKPAPLAESREVALNETAVRADFDTVAELGAQERERVTALAVQIGYEGSLTVGTLEDEIRFYQRRTVEAILETGKRLLLLKEMTPHGEFTKRAELLGFSERTARRFMQAAAKTAKSAILAGLSKQAKNGLAFLELVTHDDDELKALDGMDDVDSMSASQLRAKLREARAEKEAVERLVEAKNKQIDKLQLVKTAPADEQMGKALEEVAKRANTALGLVRGDLRMGFEALAAFEKAGENSHRGVLKGYLDDLQRELDILRADFFLLNGGGA